MTTSRRLSYLLFLVAVMQRRAYVKCYALASNHYRGAVPGVRPLPSFWRRGQYRGGAASGSQLWGDATSTSEAISTENASSLFLLEKAEETLPITGSSSMKDFGGLAYRESSDQYRVVFVLGGPGAGKGTQSELLLENYPCVHLSAGELLREETKKPDSPHAALIEQCLVGGKIVPVEISLALLENAMKASSGKSMIFLVDGFPRNFDNLEGWTRCMKSVSVVLGVLFYECPLAVLEERILERAKDSGRSDDNLQSLRKRFKTFEGDTVPVIDTLRLVQEKSQLQVVDIHGNQSLEAVWQDTQQCVNEFVSHDVLSANAKLIEATSSSDSELYQLLCAEEMFAGEAASDVMAAQEGSAGSSEITNASIDFVTGSKASVSYDRDIDGTSIRETRIWSHQGEKGWRCIHFSRSPV